MTDHTQNRIASTKSDGSDEVDKEVVDGLDPDSGFWGNYPLDDLHIRQESRTIYDVIRRIDQSIFIMDPDFQRELIWDEGKQSKLVESVVMRIPLPVFYLAENDEGQMVVVDGLQRLSTFHRFLKNELRLTLPYRKELDGSIFSDLPSKIQNRVEDCNLIFYIVDSKVPEQARLDIFERVNGGVPLTRQQMRNSLFMGPATRFLKDEANTEIFRKATGGSLSSKTMRDREFVNRYCAFMMIGVDDYHGDMDDFLARCLRKMNTMNATELERLSLEFRRGLRNNYLLFGDQAFRKHRSIKQKRSLLNASFWDVMSTLLSQYDEQQVQAHAEYVRESVYDLLANEEFNMSISYGPNDTKKVRQRFDMARVTFKETLGDL